MFSGACFTCLFSPKHAISRYRYFEIFRMSEWINGVAKIERYNRTASLLFCLLLLSRLPFDNIDVTPLKTRSELSICNAKNKRLELPHQGTYEWEQCFVKVQHSRQCCIFYRWVYIWAGFPPSSERFFASSSQPSQPPVTRGTLKKTGDTSTFRRHAVRMMHLPLLPVCNKLSKAGLRPREVG